MNDKLAKRLRRVINGSLAKYALTVRYREYAQLAVPSSAGTAVKNVETGEVMPNKAIQVRMKLDCPRQVYKRMKQHVRLQRNAA